MIGVHTCKTHGISLAVKKKKKKKSAIVTLLLISAAIKEDFFLKKSVYDYYKQKQNSPTQKTLLIYTLGGFNFPYIIL